MLTRAAAPKSGGTHQSSRDSAAITCACSVKEAGRSVTTVSLKSAAAICSRFVRVQCSATFHCDSGGFDFEVEQLSHLRRIARPEAFQVVLSCTSRY